MGHSEVEEVAARSTSHEEGDVPEKAPIQEKVVHGNEAFNEALLKEPPRKWAPSMIMIYLFSVVGFFCSTMNGYDASLINNLLQNHDFQKTYDVGKDGIGAGIVGAVAGGIDANLGVLDVFGHCIGPARKRDVAQTHRGWSDVLPNLENLLNLLQASFF
ncbi:hypothetical protein NLG97_g5555 [Lecanicillium saksenae]|uniref:Uncharacterized protein n=1 Tax=Lecanicillium saksenae TaxID=468837 RepID=A0ACC1QVY7_9HYPO|nr:hypothetical protein NLG97_g5555 [Lecanicillium saksenae]